MERLREWCAEAGIVPTGRLRSIPLDNLYRIVSPILEFLLPGHARGAGAVRE
jgi:hypothetical protein